MENTSPGADTPGPAGYTPAGSLAPLSYLLGVELRGFTGIRLKESDHLPHLLLPDPRLGVRNRGCLSEIPDFHSGASVLMALLLVGGIGKQHMVFVDNGRRIWF